MNDINMYEYQFNVKVRKYEVRVEELKDLLINHKKLLKLTSNYISQALNIKKTKVDHWFRRDNCFAIPTPFEWERIKSLLQIKTNEYDAEIMEYITKENVFEKAGRLYFIDGVAPTILCGAEPEIIVGDKI